jgi:transcriptional regulator with XRE-family HTH domain
MSADTLRWMSIKDRIRAARLRLKMTEEEFADAVGVSRGAVQQWERGVTAPRRANQPAVAKLLGITPGELMQEGEPEVAHPLDLSPYKVPLTTVWGDLMKMKKLPASFTAPMPDDSMAGSIDKGTVIYFETGLEPTPGHGVLVEDRFKAWSVRRYKKGIGDAWSAEAADKDYPSFESDRDGLKLLAVVRGIMSGKL